MDIVSHGLYGGSGLWAKKSKRFWLSFFFGIAPDLFSFGIFTIGTWIGIFDRPDWSRGQHPDPAMIPQFVSTFYDYTHSLVIFALVFGLVWLIRRRPWWIMAGWGLHILVDIPTHSSAFFPTPFLFPLSNFHIDGHPWSSPEIFLPNVILLVMLYTWFYVVKPRRVRNMALQKP
jgi:hypothetical protein